jgi:hypothetical protein
MRKEQEQKYGYVIFSLVNFKGITFEKIIGSTDIKYVSDIRKADVYETKNSAFENCVSFRPSSQSRHILHTRVAKVSLYKNGHAKKVVKMYKETQPLEV